MSGFLMLCLGHYIFGSVRCCHVALMENKRDLNLLNHLANLIQFKHFFLCHVTI